MKLRPFRIEHFYARHEFTARYMLSSSDAESWSVRELLALEPDATEAFLGQRLGYTESPGAPALRRVIATLYEKATPDDVLVCSSAEEAIFVLYHAYLGPGDHAIVESPGYESALELARSTGAEVSRWPLRWADGWRPDLDALRRLLRPSTRLVYVNTPHNPTGTQLSPEALAEIAGLCRDAGAVLFCDEVYRELEHEPADRLPAATDLDERAVSLGSMSKAYGLPGLRLGWLVTRDARLRQAALDLKHYTTICSSAPSEHLSALALRHREALLARNRDLVRGNLALLDDFFARRADRFAWVRPQAGPIGFPRVLAREGASALCQRLLDATGILLLPGEVFDEPDHVRIGFGRANLPEVLARLDAWL
jgi:aspartate/methionine/tyrosine aminotransferase